MRTKPRGQGPDPLEGTWLDKTVEQVVQPLEIHGTNVGLGPGDLVDGLRRQLRRDAGLD